MSLAYLKLLRVKIARKTAHLFDTKVKLRNNKLLNSQARGDYWQLIIVILLNLLLELKLFFFNFVFNRVEPKIQNYCYILLLLEFTILFKICIVYLHNAISRPMKYG